MKNDGFSFYCKSRTVLIFLFAFAETLAIAVPQAAADNLQPGVYGQAGGFTVSLRADCYNMVLYA